MLPSPQPPPPPSLPSPPPSEWTRLLDGGETVARRVEVLRRAGYLNCSVTNDETHDTCHRLRPDFDWMGWVLTPSAGKAARAARHNRRNTSAAAHALSQLTAWVDNLQDELGSHQRAGNSARLSAALT